MHTAQVTEEAIAETSNEGGGGAAAFGGGGGGAFFAAALFRTPFFGGTGLRAGGAAGLRAGARAGAFGMRARGSQRRGATRKSSRAVEAPR